MVKHETTRSGQAPGASQRRRWRKAGSADHLARIGGPAGVDCDLIGGSRFLGVTEDCGRFLHDFLASAEGGLPADDDGWDALALQTVRAQRAGHHVHKDGDPRTPRLLQIAAEEGTVGSHPSLFAAIGRVHPEVLGKRLPLNGAGVCGAALADLGLPLELLRGFALLARAAGLIEELRHPVGNEIFLSVDLNNRSVAPDPYVPLPYPPPETAGGRHG